jgi:protein-tyrosine phosphatase
MFRNINKMRMYEILDNLATHGIGEPGLIERYVNCEIGFINDFRIIDVRTLIDGENVPSEYLLNIVRVTSYLELREKVVICCRVGASRSNAIAVGVLVRYFKMDFYKAMELVISKVPICNILRPHITALQKLLKF